MSSHNCSYLSHELQYVYPLLFLLVHFIPSLTIRYYTEHSRQVSVTNPFSQSKASPDSFAFWHRPSPRSSPRTPTSRIQLRVVSTIAC
jgi:hypothetical protein